MTPELRVGLAGAGVIADLHAHCLKGTPGARLAAVCDLDAEKGAAFARRWGIPDVYTSIGGMLAQARVDIVHVLLPPAVHAQGALECLNHGCHVFLEKPACISTAECCEVKAAAKRAGRAVGVNHNMTYTPAYVRLLEAVRQRRLGAVEHVVVAYHLPFPVMAAAALGLWMFRQPGNLVLELGPHPASLIYPLVGPAREVCAVVSGETALPSGGPVYKTWQISMVCERGTAQQSLSIGRDYSARWCYAAGQDGEAFADLRRNTLRLTEKSRYLRGDDLWNARRGAHALLRDAVAGFVRGTLGSIGIGAGADLQSVSMNASIRAFYAALHAGQEPPVGIQEGAAVVEMCERTIAAGMRSANLEAQRAAV